jgi:hypothetical protein
LLSLKWLYGGERDIGYKQPFKRTRLMPNKQPRFTKQKQHAPHQTLKAAQYLRASTDQQQFSIENQQYVINE